MQSGAQGYDVRSAPSQDLMDIYIEINQNLSPLQIVVNYIAAKLWSKKHFKMCFQCDMGVIYLYD